MVSWRRRAQKRSDREDVLEGDAILGDGLEAGFPDERHVAGGGSLQSP